MSSMPGAISIQHEPDRAPRRAVMRWIWPAGARGVLAALLIAAAGGLAVASRSVPESGAEVVRAPDLLLDLNTVPARVLETLPHVGQTLVRQVVAAREQGPIVSLDDAGSRVRGLGPVTLAQIAPYLRFDPMAQQRAEYSGNPLEDQPAARPRLPKRKSTRSRKPKLPLVQPRLVSRSAEAAAL